MSRDTPPKPDFREPKYKQNQKNSKPDDEDDDNKSIWEYGVFTPSELLLVTLLIFSIVWGAYLIF